MATFNQNPDQQLNGHQTFMPSVPNSWHGMHSVHESLPFHPVHQHPQFFPTNPPTATHFHSHPDPSADFPTHDPNWQASPHGTAFGTYPAEPVIKPEDPTYHHQLEPLAPHHDGPPPASADPAHNPMSATSPQSENGWMSNSSSDHPERSLKRENVPFFVDNPPRLRPDGVRKKNARFEIPEDRKIDTIDRLIEAADPTDEKLLKELKQQKRLLRNRQAALDSRCRKKEHTQKLEDERKLLVQNIEIFQDQNQHYRQQEAMWLQERAAWQNTVDQLRLDKEELVRQHTLETAELRKKNNILMDDLQRRPSLSMSAVPSSAGYSSTFSEFDHLSMNDSPTWDEFSLLHQAHSDPEPSKLHSSVSHQAKEDPSAKEEDKTAASGLLLMLLLCGAWVASKGSASVSDLPQMSEDVRAASTTVLDNIYKDAGLTLPGSGGSGGNGLVGAKPQDMHSAFASANNPFSAFNHLTAPTMQQQRDEAFSLTPTQYNSLTTDESTYVTPHPSPTGPKRNLRGALSAMRFDRPGTASDVYTSSLMWDEVPANVIRDFARMIGEQHADPMS